MSEHPKIFEHLPALCNQIKRLAIEAGDVALEYFDESGYHGAQTKDDGSPVTEADKATEALIIEKLSKISDSVPIIGEESVSDDMRESLSDNRFFWLVDPIDGTREFIRGCGDFTVNIALIDQGVPVLGVIYAPFHGELYAGYKDGPATRWLEDSDTEKAITTRGIPHKGITVTSSKSQVDNPKMMQFLEQFIVQKILQRGSSIKMAMIATGKADLYPRFGQTCEWDTAAADAILRSAGGHMTLMDGKTPLQYGGSDPKFLNPEFIAWSGELYTLYQSLIEDDANGES